MVSFEGRVVIVTGAGRGLGRSYALEMAALGAAVVVNDVAATDGVEQSRADSVVDEISNAGGRAVASYDTVATTEGARAIIGRALDAFGTVDAVVHNAGFLREDFFEDLTTEQWADVIGVHLGGAFFISKAAWPELRRERYGRIVFVGSSAGLWGRVACANCAAAKAGIWGLCRGLALEGQEYGVFTNYLMPAASTPIGDEGGVPPASHDWMAERMAEIELPDRRLDPSWVSPMAAYLASESCTVNGEAFSAIYGRYARVVSGVLPWWVSQGPRPPSATELQDHLGEIVGETDVLLPRDVFDELHELSDRLRGAQVQT